MLKIIEKPSAFTSLSQVTGDEVFPGFSGKFVHSDDMTVAHWTIEAGNEVPEHCHPQEQIVNVLKGRFRMTVGEETRDMAPGDVAVIPPHVPHKAQALSDCICLDVFTPGRSDYTNEV